ncbi:NADH dehydrogenase [ubiquinone] 1 beta subcomplex subunit 2, mitochondrial [Mixophyes fleayi]|uniref:NADH dehydrogenase [ubiquinone] 1 beta subcomplex subunit 2, mitochondrial n=1 Tax=Mixophyes fleayi TaxID=3061075 RepID=UPI003F4E24A9
MAALVRIGGALRAGSRLIGGVVRRKPGVRNAGTEVHIVPRYRQMTQLTKSQCFQAELVTGFMWFWILWHLWHDPDAVLGHFPYPDPAQWTDEELGILPEDEE